MQFRNNLESSAEIQKKAEKLHSALKDKEAGDRDGNAKENMEIPQNVEKTQKHRKNDEGAGKEKAIPEDKECLSLAPDKKAVTEVSPNSGTEEMQERKDDPNFPGTANKGKRIGPEQKSTENTAQKKGNNNNSMLPQCNDTNNINN